MLEPAIEYENKNLFMIMETSYNLCISNRSDSNDSAEDNIIKINDAQYEFAWK